jgi:hypothetical protein
MALIMVRRLNFDAQTAYAPPQEDAILNTEDVLSVVQTEARGSGPFLYVRFRNGDGMTIVGDVGGFLAAAASAEREAAERLKRRPGPSGG